MSANSGNSGNEPEITGDMVSERLASLTLDGDDEPTPAELAYHRAAAVLVSFDPERLRPVGTEPDAEALAALLRACEPARRPDGTLAWRLPDPLRRETLTRLGGAAEARRWLAANDPEDTPLQRMLTAYLTRSAAPPERQPYEDLLATAQVVAWLGGIVPGTPEPALVTDRLAVAELLIPMRRLVGSSFRGRQRVLDLLHDHTDILPPDGHGKAIRRHLRRVLRLGDHPPLVLCGPGGVGKSTVLAKFLLDHADADDQVPFVYIDFDRPGMIPQEPLTLLIEALRQVGVQFPAVRPEAELIRATWLERLARPDFNLLSAAVHDPATQRPDRPDEVPEQIKLRSQVPMRAPFTREFGRLAGEVATEVPLLLCLDTFEVVQRYGADVIAEVWDLLESLQRELPSLRVVIAGRAPLVGHPTRTIPLEGFDAESARGFVASILGEDLAADVELVDHILRVAGTNPLSLRLAADLAANHGRSDLDAVERRRVLFVRMRAEQVQGWLYRRILDRIADPSVRALAHPGLVVRRLTPGVIRHVLAGPSGLDVGDDEQARALFDACAREVSLLAWTTDGALEHRADIRREMLPLLRRSEPERVAEIHRAAVAWYERHDDLTSRAEELYHRLCLGEGGATVDGRWRRGVENLLARSLDELPAQGQVYLAAQLGVTLPRSVLVQARAEERERYVATRVRQLISFGELDEALVALRGESERAQPSDLDLLEAQVLEEQGHLDEAAAVIDGASQRSAAAGDGDSLVELQYVAARLAERRGDHDRALILLAAVGDAAGPAPRDELLPLRLAVAVERNRRLAGRAFAGAVQPRPVALEFAELARLLRVTPLERVQQDPALLLELAAESGAREPDLVIEALGSVGLEPPGEALGAGLGDALAGWDRANSDEPAKSLGVRGGGARAWLSLLRTGLAGSKTTRSLAQALRRYPEERAPVVELLASAYRDSLASRAATPGRPARGTGGPADHWGRGSGGNTGD